MQSKTIIKNKYPTNRFRLAILTAIFLIVIFSVLFITRTASANWQSGFTSFFSSILGGEKASAKIAGQKQGPSSQTIALLQAATNPDPNPNKQAPLLPVDRNALVADISASDIGDNESFNTQISVYTVRSGDNLSTIAKMFGVSVNTIMWANDLTKASSIQPGQTLVILPVTGINYTIKKGDTIKGIVSYYKADLEEVLAYNDLTLSSTLVVGQTIIIPDAELRTVVPSKATTPSYDGYYSRPIVGGRISQGLHGHNGVDLAAPVGTPIYAAAAGTVILSKSSGYNGGYGSYIIIAHPNNTQTVYAHNLKNFVTVGQRVEKGEEIALIGLTGKTTGPHVHFEIRGAKNPF